MFLHLFFSTQCVYIFCLKNISHTLISKINIVVKAIHCQSTDIVCWVIIERYDLYISQERQTREVNYYHQEDKLHISSHRGVSSLLLTYTYIHICDLFSSPFLSSFHPPSPHHLSLHHSSLSDVSRAMIDPIEPFEGSAEPPKLCALSLTGMMRERMQSNERETHNTFTCTRPTLFADSFKARFRISHAKFFYLRVSHAIPRTNSSKVRNKFRHL